MAEKKEIVKKNSNQDLAHLQTTDPNLMGTDNIDNTDLIVPRMKCVQPLTKEKFSANDGDLINNLTGKNYGKSVNIIPIVHWKSHIYFVDMDIQCRSNDGKVSMDGQDCKQCGKFMFDKEGNKPVCNVIYNYMIATEDEIKEAIKNKEALSLSPLVLSFMSAGIKTAKVINTSIKLNASRKFPIYSQYFTLTVPDKPREFTKGSAYMIDAKVGRYLDKNEAPFMQAMFIEFDKMNKIQINLNLDQSEIEPDKDEPEI